MSSWWSHPHSSTDLERKESLCANGSLKSGRPVGLAGSKQAYSHIPVRAHGTSAEQLTCCSASVSTTCSWWGWPRPEPLIDTGMHMRTFLIWCSCQHAAPSASSQSQRDTLRGGRSCTSPVIFSADAARVWWQRGKHWWFPGAQDNIVMALFLRYSIRSISSLAVNGERLQP